VVGWDDLVACLGSHSKCRSVRLRSSACSVHTLIFPASLDWSVQLLSKVSRLGFIPKPSALWNLSELGSIVDPPRSEGVQRSCQVSSLSSVLYRVRYHTSQSLVLSVLDDCLDLEAFLASLVWGKSSFVVRGFMVSNAHLTWESARVHWLLWQLACFFYYHASFQSQQHYCSNLCQWKTSYPSYAAWILISPFDSLQT